MPTVSSSQDGSTATRLWEQQVGCAEALMEAGGAPISLLWFPTATLAAIPHFYASSPSNFLCVGPLLPQLDCNLLGGRGTPLDTPAKLCTALRNY